MRELRGTSNFIALFLAIGLAGFQIYTSATFMLQPLQQGALFVGIMVILTFFLYPFKANSPAHHASALDYILIGVAVFSFGCIYFKADELLIRSSDPQLVELIAGLGAIVLTLEAVRRSCGKVTGWFIVSLILLFFLYGLFGEMLSGAFRHQGYSLERIITINSLFPSGIFGTPSKVMTEVIIMFFIFGAFAQRLGLGDLIDETSRLLVGRLVGGAGKGAVVSSGLAGMISGSGVANVMITGIHTIPYMKRSGFDPKTAAGIEAVASTGGVFLPPIMGSAAFIMAEFLGTSYYNVMLVAFAPAIIYYVSVYLFVDLYSRKNNLQPAVQREKKRYFPLIQQYWHVCVSFLSLIVLILMHYPIMRAVFVSIVIMVVLDMLKDVARKKLPDFKKYVLALRDGIYGSVMVSVISAAVGTIESISSSTGLTFRFVNILADLSGGNMLLIVIIAALVSVLLGLGMVPTAAYVLLGVLIAPAMINAGINEFAAHFFILYMTTLGAITPPVALSSYIAAGVAGTDPLSTSVRSARIGFVGFLIPFLFVFNPSLIAQNGIFLLAEAFLTALISILFLNIAVEGYFRRKWSWVGRSCILIFGMMLFIPNLMIDVIAMVGGFICILWEEKPFTKQARVGESSIGGTDV